jgi:hypothetical protein
MSLNRGIAGAVAAAALLLVGGGAALAASRDGARSERCEKRLLARIDRAETAGRISPQHAGRLRERAERLCSVHPRARIAAFGMLRAAADFLDLDRAELRAQLPGSSLAELAEGQGKSVAQLEETMVGPAKARLARAVKSGRITQARADAAVERLETLARRLATRVFPSS